MFTKAEIHIVAKTLTQRRDWLIKNMDNPDLAANKPVNQQTLALIDSALTKLLQLNSTLQNTTEVPAPQQKSIRVTATQKRTKMAPDEIRVLVVDDDEIIATVLQSLLNNAGVTHVDIAQDGLKAITMLYEAEHVYDLVLCDWNMPIKSGIDVHNAMRASERYIDACFMLVTAVTEAKQIKAAIEDGVDDYVVKPIEEQKMLKKIQRYFPKITTEDN